MEVNESLDSIPAVGVLDGRETIIGPAGVERGKDKGERCESRRSNGEDH